MRRQPKLRRKIAPTFCSARLLSTWSRALTRKLCKALSRCAGRSSTGLVFRCEAVYKGSNVLTVIAAGVDDGDAAGVEVFDNPGSTEEGVRLLLHGGLYDCT